MTRAAIREGGIAEYGSRNQRNRRPVVGLMWREITDAAKGHDTWVWGQRGGASIRMTAGTCPKAASMADSATALIAFPRRRVKRKAKTKDTRSKP
jgi:hypothetical protein